MNIDNAVWQCLLKAIDRFNQSGDPKSLLCPRNENPTTKSDWTAASERAIAYRLAFYLETELRRVPLVGDYGPLTVDCEYNRHLAEGKSLAAEAAEEIKQIVKQARKKELEENDDGFYVFSVAPDILVHQRRTDANNILVVEIKKRSNPETDKYDRLKLELFTSPKEDERGYGYKIGAWIVAEDNLRPHERRLRLVRKFKDGVESEVEV